MGILSLQIHQISGLEFEQINKPRDESDISDDTAAGSDDLPSSYCTVILNHQKIFKTRTKPKSSEPFFNAGTERFIRDVSLMLLVSAFRKGANLYQWRNAEILVYVRDSRVHENDPLVGPLESHPSILVADEVLVSTQLLPGNANACLL